LAVAGVFFLRAQQWGRLTCTETMEESGGSRQGATSCSGGAPPLVRVRARVRVRLRVRARARPKPNPNPNPSPNPNLEVDRERHQVGLAAFDVDRLDAARLGGVGVRVGSGVGVGVGVGVRVRVRISPTLI